MDFYQTVVKRSRETTVVEDEYFVENTAFLLLRKMQAVGGMLAFLVGVSAMVLVVYQGRFVKRTSTQNLLYKLLILHVSANIVSNFHMMLLGTIQIDPDHWRLCSFLGSMPGPIYVTSHAFSNLIFLQRSRIVTKNMQTSKIMDITLKLATLGTYIMLFVAGAIYVFLRGKLLPNGVCTHTYPWWGAIIVLITDLSLSLAFLILFVEPLRQQAKFLSEHAAMADSSMKLMNVARKNLRWGSFSLGTTFCFTMIVILARITLALNSSGGVYAVYMLDWAFGPLETTANLVAALNLTAPVWKRQYHKLLPRSTQSRSGSYATKSNYNFVRSSLAHHSSAAKNENEPRKLSTVIRGSASIGS